MDTLLLDPDTWDLKLDVSGNIAVATGAYAQAQDAASQCKLFKTELFYDTRQGIPYWQQILGRLPPVQLMTAKYVAAAKVVPGVVSAKCFTTSYITRGLTGQVQIMNELGQIATARF